MEKSVKGIRETYFRDIIKDYDIWKEESVLYRIFWAEGVKDMLKKYLPPLPKKAELKKLNEQFLEPLMDEKNGQKQMEECYARLPDEVKKLLEVHLPQLPEDVVDLLREAFGRLPEAVKELLQETFPWLLKEETSWPEYEDKIKELLEKNIRERPEWAGKALLQKAPRKVPRGKGKGERRDFGAELWLNDVGYEMGKISDTGYYLWLVEYLAARGYYKDGSMRDGHVWLYRLLMYGLGLKPEVFQKDHKNLCNKLDTENYLAELAEKIRQPSEAEKAELTEEVQRQQKEEREKIANRLHNVKRPQRNRAGRAEWEDYLPWLTARLRQMTVHIRARRWLQDNGYPLAKEGESRRPPKEWRKQDSSMRLFEVFCNSKKGYDFYPKADKARQMDAGWSVEDGFCVWQPDGFEDILETLQEALLQKGKKSFYFPLAMDLYSGCVFFLASKGYYQYVYADAGDKDLLKEYNNKKALFCYDYLRLAEEEDDEDCNVTFQLRPTFLENAGELYEKVFQSFQDYCTGSRAKRQWESRTIDGSGNEYYYENVDHIPRKKIKAFNEERPLDAPEVFQWAFDGVDDREPNLEARRAFQKTRDNIEKEERSRTR